MDKPKMEKPIEVREYIDGMKKVTYKRKFGFVEYLYDKHHKLERKDYFDSKWNQTGSSDKFLDDFVKGK